MSERRNESSAARRRRWWREPPEYCGAIEPHRLLGPIFLVWVAGTRYLQIRPLGVFKRV